MLAYVLEARDIQMQECAEEHGREKHYTHLISAQQLVGIILLWKL